MNEHELRYLLYATLSMLLLLIHRERREGWASLIGLLMSLTCAGVAIVEAFKLLLT